MRKNILPTLVVLMMMSVAAMAVNKKDKNKKLKTTGQVQPVSLITGADSVSYAAGVAATQGLVPFIRQQYGVDTTYMADFVQGLRDALNKGEDPVYKAYVAGESIARVMGDRIIVQARKKLEGTPDSLESRLFEEGFIAALQGDTTHYTVARAEQFYHGRLTAAEEAKHAVYKKENADWLARNAQKPGVVTLPSGLQYKVLTAGTGAKHKAEDEVTVKYVGKLIDGTEFDNSYNRTPQTTTFRCDQVIKGWTEALLMMPVGSKWELFIPQELGYGNRQAGKIKPYSTLVFTVELVK